MDKFDINNFHDLEDTETWLDRAKQPENANELAKHIYSFLNYYNGIICVDYEKFKEKYPFLKEDAQLEWFIQELRIANIYFKPLLKINLDKLGKKYCDKLWLFKIIN
jgi:hypothetical protein